MSEQPDVAATVANATAAAEVASTALIRPMYFALGFMVTAATGLIIMAGNRVRQSKKREIDKLKTEGLPAEPKEFLGIGDAARFPITGSCVLGGLYLVINYLPKEVITYALVSYLTFISVSGIAVSVRPFFGANVGVGIVSWAIGAAYLYTKHWVLNNIMAFAICIVAMESVPIKSFQTSALLLSGLFFYDIFWVFGTDVMVTVAKNVEGPIKILFPQDIFGDHGKKSLLGLGDIVIPGFFVMQTIRMGLLWKAQGKAKSASVYYNVAIVAYVLSLLNTMFVMVYFEAAQPALLYIVPWLLITALGTALARGELRMLWNFDEEVADEEMASKPAATAPPTAPPNVPNAAKAANGGTADPTAVADDDASTAAATVKQPPPPPQSWMESASEYASGIGDALWQAVLLPFGLDRDTVAELAAAKTKRD